IGRDPATIRRSAMKAFIVGGSPVELRERSKAMQHALPQLGPIPVEELPARTRERGWLTGTPDEVVGQIKELEAAGLQRIMLQHPLQTDFAALELIAREVMPAVAG